MKKWLSICLLLFLLAACGKESSDSNSSENEKGKSIETSANKKTENTKNSTNGSKSEGNSTNEDGSTEERLMPLDVVNQLGNDGFIDSSFEELFGSESIGPSHELAVSEKDGYTYVMLRLEDKFRNYKVFVSVAKDKIWILKGKEISINVKTGDSAFIFGDQTLVQRGQNYFLLSINEKGDVIKETPFPISGLLKTVYTTKGIGLISIDYSKLILLSEPEKTMSLPELSNAIKENEPSKLFFDFKHNMLYMEFQQSNGPTKFKRFDLTKNELVYDANGQEMVSEIPNKDAETSQYFRGTDKDGNLYYLYQNETDRKMRVSLYDKNTFKELATTESDLGGIEGNEVDLVVTDDEIHFYRDIEFKGKPSIQFVNLSK